MKFKVYIILIGTFLFTGCYSEEIPEPKWEYTGPIPEITDGPSDAQKMCYQLYTRYGLNVYYNLSGIMAGRTEIGYVQTQKISEANEKALPFVAADEQSAGIFLKLLTGLFSLLPDDMVSRGLYHRQVLVKINPGPIKIRVDTGHNYFSCAHTEEQKGIILYGYLMSEEDDKNTLILNPDGWKWNICYNFFRGHVNGFYKKDMEYPADFERVSEGLYYYDNAKNANLLIFRRGIYQTKIAKECGFVHPYGGRDSWKGNSYTDWGSYVAWILTVPPEERAADIEQWSRIKMKYDIVMNYYKERYDMDLERIGDDYRALSVE